MEFYDGFEKLYTFNHDLELIEKLIIQLTMMTNSCSFYDVSSKARFTTERRLMINFQIVKDAYQAFDSKLLHSSDSSTRLTMHL